MPLFLVRVRREVEVVEEGNFSLEADDADSANQKAKEAIADGSADIDWGDRPYSWKTKPATHIEEIEILANGTEDITEHF